MAVNAVTGCESLRYVSLPSTLRIVVNNTNRPEERRDAVFRGDYGIQMVEIADGNPWYRATENGIYSKDGRNLLYWFPGSPVTYGEVPSDVICIEPDAFRGNQHLKKLVVPDFVKEIGKSAFCGCESLEELQLPKELSYCGESIITDCDALKEIRIREGLEDLGGRVAYCDALTKIYLPASMKSLSEGISECNALKEIIISDQNPYLEADSTGCYTKGKETLLFLLKSSQLTEYTAPDNLREIGDGLFEENCNLVRVDLNRVERIGDYAFHSCENRQSVVSKNKIKSVGEDAFGECSKLTEVVFQGTVDQIGSNAFHDCISLKEFTVPEGIEYMDDILEGCSALEKITLPSTMKGFCDDEGQDVIPFYGVTSLQQIEVSADNPYLKMEEDALYTKGGKILLYYCINATNEVYHVATGTAMIGAGAFCRSYDEVETLQKSCLREVSLPAGVQEIRRSAFEECDSLLKINFPDSLLSIRKDAFLGCDQLENIVMGENCGLQEIEGAAFAECSSFTSITLLQSVRIIEDSMFWDCDQQRRLGGRRGLR